MMRRVREFRRSSKFLERINNRKRGGRSARKKRTGSRWAEGRSLEISVSRVSAKKRAHQGRKRAKGRTRLKKIAFACELAKAQS